MSLRRILYIGALLSCWHSPRAQVNFQTGSAVYSMPIFQWQDVKGRLTSTVSLNYSSGNGLKVNDVASNIGTGWNLSGGGVITRMQVGEPDDQPAYSGTAAYGNGSDQDVTKYPAGYLYATVPAANGCPNALTKYPIYGAKNQVYTQHNVTAEDKQMDYFSFQFNGKSGIFVLDASNGDKGKSLGDSKMNITFQRDPTMTSQGIRTTITSFSIQDADGLIYKFTKHGLTKLLKASFCDAKVTKPQTQPKISNGGIYHQAGFDQGPTAYPWVNKDMAYPYVIGSWYLSEVDDPLTSRKLLFNYVTRNINTQAGADINFNLSLDQYVVISHKTSITSSPELSSIVYPDGHTLTLNYSATQRADFAGEYPISSIDVTYLDRGTTRYVSRFELNTTYFILNRYGTPTTDYQKSTARLCLRSIRKIGVDLKEDTPPYIFDYYTGSNTVDDFVPPPFFYAKDVWGFYNGSYSVKSNNSGQVPLVNTTLAQLDYYSLKGLCFLNDAVTGINLNPKSGYAQNGLLKQIIYPTGGTLTYQYGQNAATLVGSSYPYETTVGGVHVSSTSSADGGYSNGCGNPVVTQYNYVMNGTGSASSLWGMEMPVNSLVSNNNFAWEKMTIHWSLTSCFLGCCKWHYTFPGILSQTESVSLTDFQKFMDAIAPVLGVLSVITDIMDVVNVCLDATPLAIVAVALDIIAGALAWFLTCSRYTKYTPDTIYYNFDLNGMATLPAQFKRVEIIENPGTIGKTVQEFTSSDDYPLWQPTNPTFSAKQRFAPWAYGLPKLISVYDAGGHLVRQTKNIYDTTYARQVLLQDVFVGHQIPPAVASCKCQVIQNYSQNNTDWGNASLYNAPASYITTSNSGVLNVDIYNFYTGRMELDSVFERVFKPTDANQVVETITRYTYAPNNLLHNSTTVVQSNGDKTSKYIRYSSDDGSTYGVQLWNNNILNEPMETYTIIIPKGSVIYDYPIDDLNYYANIYGDNTYFLTGDKVTEYTQLANGDIRPLHTLEERMTQPIPGVSSSFFGAPPNYKTPEAFTYDANSNLSSVTDEGGRVATNIYDYNDKYVVGFVINADPVLDKPAFTSFESGDLSRSGWALTGTSAYNNNAPSFTGTANFSLLASGANSLSSGALNTARPYILSFWATNANTTVTGGTLAKSGPTYSGYTYYEYSVAQGTASVQLKNNAGTAVNIDELRLYPKTARMRTLTYDPLVGKTSECDENNRVTYFTYDNLGRLQLAQDENRNILKAFEYNNVSAAKQNGCPGTFSSRLVTEIFNRSNCSAGYYGGPVTFSVPAGKYSSAISQEDADLKAELDLLTNGPTAANSTGACNLIYYNVALSETDTTQTCDLGYAGGLVTYTVPAATYSSIISQADANQQALDDIAANGQAYANDIGHAICTIDTNPDWEWSPGEPSYCQTINGQLPAHQFILVTDINPNSPTHGQQQWEDSGPSSNCPSNAYYNASRSGTYTRNNCVGGGGQTVTYTVAPGTYSSTVSQAAADQLAQNDIAANGQAYANAHGNCCSPLLAMNGAITSIMGNNMYLSGSTTVNYIWVFSYPSGYGSTLSVGQIGGSCTWPTSTRTIPFIQGSTTYNLLISPTGAVTLQVVSGPVPTGVIGLTGSYDLNLNAFYSAPYSASFTKNDCPAGQVGSSVTVSAPAYQYKSYVSQADANQLAINSVNSSGQSTANASGTCSTPCGFTWSSGIPNHLGNTLSSTSTTVSFNLVFIPPANGYYGGTLGTISGGCIPSGYRNVTVADGAHPGRTWSVSISPTGVVSISIGTGPAGTTSYPPIVLIGTFPK